MEPCLTLPRWTITRTDGRHQAYSLEASDATHAWGTFCAQVFPGLKPRKKDYTITREEQAP